VRINKIFPKKLSKGNEIRIVAPARSLSIISPSVRSIAIKRLEEMGLTVSFSRHCDEIDEFDSSSIESRLADIHEAFSDPKVKAILTVIGGYNSIQLLKNLDYELITNNPKIFCGYSDITTLQNAIFSKTGLITYSGPHFSTLGCLKETEYMIDNFKKCLFFEMDNTSLEPSSFWSDDEWYINQEKRQLSVNSGYKMIQPGTALGTIIGGNIGSLSLLQGTEYFPSIKDGVLFLEDNYPMTIEILDRHIHSLILQKDFLTIKGIVFGRFQKESKIDCDSLQRIITSKKELNGIPIIAEADFGHTLPLLTFPIGGEVRVEAANGNVKIKVSER